MPDHAQVKLVAVEFRCVQVYSQPVFAACEPLLRRLFPKTIGRLRPRMLSIVFRSLYVVATTFISCLL